MLHVAVGGERGRLPSALICVLIWPAAAAVAHSNQHKMLQLEPGWWRMATWTVNMLHRLPCSTQGLEDLCLGPSPKMRAGGNFYQAASLNQITAPDCKVSHGAIAADLWPSPLPHRCYTMSSHRAKEFGVRRSLANIFLCTLLKEGKSGL